MHRASSSSHFYNKTDLERYLFLSTFSFNYSIGVIAAVKLDRLIVMLNK